MAVGLIPPKNKQAYLGNPQEESEFAIDLARHGYPVTAVRLLRAPWVTEEYPYGPSTPDVGTNRMRDDVITRIFLTYGEHEIIDGELYPFVIRDRQRQSNGMFLYIKNQITLAGQS